MKKYCTGNRLCILVSSEKTAAETIVSDSHEDRKEGGGNRRGVHVDQLSIEGGANRRGVFMSANIR